MTDNRGDAWTRRRLGLGRITLAAFRALSHRALTTAALRHGRAATIAEMHKTAISS